MPEIVEVELQAEELNELIVEDKIVDIIFHDKGDRIIRPVTEEEFKSKLIGQEFKDVYRLGKQIWFYLSGGFYMTSHLRMTGRWLLDVPEEKIGHSRITFKLASGRILRYSDVRVFGVIKFESHEKSLEGEDVWDSDYTDLYNVLYKTPRARNLNIKQFLLKQDILCGLGNVYANETLHRAKIHPATPAEQVLNDWDGVERLVESMKKSLYEGYNYGGLSLKDYYHVDGTKGKAQEHLRVYKRTTCDCGCSIVYTKDIDGRATYYCPRCQDK